MKLENADMYKYNYYYNVNNITIAMDIIIVVTNYIDNFSNHSNYKNYNTFIDIPLQFKLINLFVSKLY